MDNHTLLNSAWAITPEAYQHIANYDLDKLPDPVAAYIVEQKVKTGCDSREKTHVEWREDYLRQFEENILLDDDGVATLNVSGPLMPNPDVIDRYYFDAADSIRIASLIRAATEAPEVEKLVLNINSPGGAVVGTPEMGDALRKFNESGKESVAIGQVLIASAAYWFASQATRIEVTQSAMIGSIGVLRPHIDASEYYSKSGINVQVFRSGKYKAAGAYSTALTDVQSEEIQDSIDSIHEDFKRAVNLNRTISQEHMEGQVFYGKDAVEIGIADKLIHSASEVYNNLKGDYDEASVRGSVDTKTQTTMSKVSENEKQGAQDEPEVKDLESVNSDQEVANARIDELESENSTIAEANDELNNQVETLSKERDDANERISTLETELAERDSKMEELEGLKEDFESKVEQAANEKAKELAEELAEKKAAEIAAKNGGVDEALQVSGDKNSEEAIEDSQIALLSDEDLWKKHSEIKKEKGSDAATEFYRNHIRNK